jgi:hypothetical protein
MATRIQSLERGRQTQQDMLQFKQWQDDTEWLEATMATKIQSRARGRSRRFQVQQQHEMAARIQARARGWQEREARSGLPKHDKSEGQVMEQVSWHEENAVAITSMGQNMAHDAAATRIQCIHRGRSDRQMISQRGELAARIQSLERGRQTRQEVVAFKQRQDDTAWLEENTAAAAAGDDDDVDDGGGGGGGGGGCVDGTDGSEGGGGPDF